jgi:hypothetical protein
MSMWKSMLLDNKRVLSLVATLSLAVALGATLGASGCREKVLCDCTNGCDCGPGLTCITAASACAAPDATCASGQRFDESAGARGGFCVGEEPDLGGGAVDLAMSMSTDDMMSMPQPDLTVPCGYPGEACCTGQFAPCNDGLACVANKCMVNDVWLVGYYVDINTFKQVGVTVHYDGTSWTLGPEIRITTPTPTAVIPMGVWGLAPDSYRIVGDKGQVFLYLGGASPRWALCGTGFGCATPSTTNQLSTILGFSGSDYWIGGYNAMYQCNGSTCTAKTTGLPASWAVGNFSGSSSRDLWYAAIDKAFHYDGTQWTEHSGLEARAVWSPRPGEAWVGNTKLQHFDGTNWSQPYLVNGAAVTGNVFGMSGSASDDVWAVGYNGSNGAHPSFAIHWDGDHWSYVALPANTADLDSVWAASRNEVFAAGGSAVYKWNGSTWSAMTLPTIPNGIRWSAIAGSARQRPR